MSSSGDDAPTQPPKRERPVVVPEFGNLLVDLRGKRSRGLVVRILLDSYALKLDDTSLLQYERGTVAAPDPAILWALSRIYGADFEELISALVMERTGREVAVAGDPGGPLDIDADERSLIHALRSLPPERRQFYVELWADTTRRELESAAAARTRGHTSDKKSG
jgi:transcriptional regulator with XRE-family HTH domain